jgi:hypothetical protein
VNAGYWIGLAGIILGVIGIVVTIAAARRWGNRRRKLLFSFESAPLLPPGPNNGLLEITYHGFPVEDPHLVTVRLQNIGPLDIPSGQFDAESPLTINLNCKMFGVTSNRSGARVVAPAIGGDGFLQIGPQMLHRGEEWVVEAVVQGDAEPTLDSPLIDTDIVEGPSMLEQVAEQLAGITLTLPFGVQLQIKR